MCERRKPAGSEAAFRMLYHVWQPDWILYLRYVLAPESRDSVPFSRGFVFDELD